MITVTNFICMSTVLMVSSAAPYKPSSREIIRAFKESKLSREEDLKETKDILEELAQLAHETFYGTKDFLSHSNYDGNSLSKISSSVLQPGTTLPVAKLLFEGDILLTPNQARTILNGFRQKLQEFKRRKRRKIIKDPTAKWKLPIAYEINKGLGEDVVAAIHKAISYWESVTCIKFEENDDPQGDYIEFFKGIESKDEVYLYDTPYDLGSIMHYGSHAFSIDWKKETIVTNIPAYQLTIGQREKPSFYDVMVLNKYYCSDKCQGKSIECHNGGYQHPGDCRKCLCPDGLGGKFCDENEPPLNAKSCGGVIELKEKAVTISSPGYPDAGYDANQKCSWFVKAPEGKTISLEFVEKFQFMCTKTCLDFVEVKNATDLGLTGIRYCCWEKPSYKITSASNLMVVIFRSYSRDYGFKAELSYHLPKS